MMKEWYNPTVIPHSSTNTNLTKQIILHRLLFPGLMISSNSEVTALWKHIQQLRYRAKNWDLLSCMPRAGDTSHEK